LCHNPTPAGYVGRKLKEQEGIPYILVFHSYAELDRVKGRPMAKQAYRKAIEEADSVVTVSEKMRGEIQQFFSTPVEIVRNGYDEREVQAARERGGTDPDELLLLSVGSFVERKGQLYLLKAISRLLNDGVVNPSVLECLLVGSGPMESRLKNYVTENGLDDVVSFRSNIPRAELNDLMRDATIFVLPSWDEPCATVYSEVMPYGTPVVLCKGEGFSELIEHGENGMLVEPRNAASIAENLRRLLVDDDLRKRVGRNGRKFAEANLSWPQNAKQIVEIIAAA
jgi:glycosyltransferase involved in cell wall biosynthesis